MFLEERHQAALDHTAQLLQEAATHRLLQNAPHALPWWRSSTVVWRPVQFTLRFPILMRPHSRRSI
ncbi:hypothetical protein ACFFLM_18195 [Deinococcus oregonensis]|uniref:Uncharacterized protein n=1 Tax=Deinococcus oregonensis TaxID=1805970 RepID=A0ABV6B289_9DEIO